MSLSNRIIFGCLLASVFFFIPKIVSAYWYSTYPDVSYTAESQSNGGTGWTGRTQNIQADITGNLSAIKVHGRRPSAGCVGASIYIAEIETATSVAGTGDYTFLGEFGNVWCGGVGFSLQEADVDYFVEEGKWYALSVYNGAYIVDFVVKSPSTTYEGSAYSRVAGSSYDYDFKYYWEIVPSVGTDNFSIIYPSDYSLLSVNTTQEIAIECYSSSSNVYLADKVGDDFIAFSDVYSCTSSYAFIDFEVLAGNNYFYVVDDDYNGSSYYWRKFNYSSLEFSSYGVRIIEPSIFSPKELYSGVYANLYDFYNSSTFPFAFGFLSNGMRMDYLSDYIEQNYNIVLDLSDFDGIVSSTIFDIDFATAFDVPVPYIYYIPATSTEWTYYQYYITDDDDDLVGKKKMFRVKTCTDDCGDDFIYSGQVIEAVANYNAIYSDDVCSKYTEPIAFGVCGLLYDLTLEQKVETAYDKILQTVESWSIVLQNKQIMTAFIGATGTEQFSVEVPFFMGSKGTVSGTIFSTDDVGGVLSPMYELIQKLVFISFCIGMMSMLFNFIGSQLND